jgi:hypothetical protein
MHYGTSPRTLETRVVANRHKALFLFGFNPVREATR